MGRWSEGLRGGAISARAMNSSQIMSSGRLERVGRGPGRELVLDMAAGVLHRLDTILSSRRLSVESVSTTEVGVWVMDGSEVRNQEIFLIRPSMLNVEHCGGGCWRRPTLYRRPMQVAPPSKDPTSHPALDFIEPV